MGHTVNPVQIAVRMPLELWRELKAEADSRGIPMSTLIRILLTNALHPGTYA
ncbi:MAG: hypothetical protein P1P84_02500 [Deferrisomatales bacterium]|nr:hypothetical protein [Deferrisomatales bacterium]